MCLSAFSLTFFRCSGGRHGGEGWLGEEVVEQWKESWSWVRYTAQLSPHFPTSCCVNSHFLDLRLSFSICKVRIRIHTIHHLMYLRISVRCKGFRSGSVIKNTPANAGDMGSIPGPGRSHMPRSNEVHAPQWSQCCGVEPVF